MPVYKDENPTKDGRQWFFRSRYKDLDGTKKQYHSKKYATRREALEAEAEFKIKALEEANVSTVTFQQMIELFIEQRSSSVKETTMYNYQNKKRFLEPLYNIRLTNFNIETYERWRQYINRCNIGTRYKNDIYKFLKSVLNYATDWYGFNFVHVYRKMQNFNNPNEMPKEMLFFTYDEFQQFLCDLVGKENVIYSAIHFDEDTPHMHFYFTPIVNEVHRKVFETDNDGKQIMKSYIGKDGIQKLIPIQKKDETGKNIYTIEKGKFLNSDQFWKNKGFKTSYAKIQDDYNKYITDKGFNLDRGQIGANKHHTTKAEKYLEEIQEETKLVKEEYNQNKALNSLEIKYKDKISSVDINTLLSPEKGKFLGYKDKDITNLSNYSKELTKDNLNKEKELQQKDVIINNKEQYIKNLSSEIKKLKSGKTIQEKDIIIESQKNIIKEKDNIIYSLKQEISDLKTFIHDKLEDVKDVAVNLYKALKRTLGFDVNKHQEYDESSFKNISKNINKKYDKNKSDDFEL